MGRRRNRGESRSAGAGRPCVHPFQDRQFQLDGDVTRQLCHRCGQLFLVTDDEPCMVLICTAPGSRWLRKTTEAAPMPYCTRHAKDRLLGGWLDAEPPHGP